MNCSQTRAMLATYRDNNQADSASLDQHLAECAACREAYAQNTFIGEGIRLLPGIEPAADAHAKLMQALAVEHMHFLQSTPTAAASTPTPAFLIPYFKEHTQKVAQTDALAAFSSAATGPLSIVQPTKRRSIYQMNHLTILGLAASFLMLVMVGGLTSLLLLANQGSSSITGNGAGGANIYHNEVIQKDYPATAAYPNVASAFADGTNIYYSTYNSNQTSWMLEQYNNKTATSTALFETPSLNPVIILGHANGWLVWLQIEPARAADTKLQHGQPPTEQARAWSIHTTFVGAPGPAARSIEATDPALYSDIFQPESVPSWVHTPVQGISFTQNTLLIALIDGKGVSHLWSYQLDSSKKSVSVPPMELSNANNGHVLAYPTANSDGSAIYWSEEWWSSSQNMLDSDIWTQQTMQATPKNTGRWAAHLETTKYLFRADEHSFHPQVVQDMLFLLSNSGTTQPVATVQTTPTQVATPGITSTPAATPDTTATPTVTPTPIATPVPVDAASILGGIVKVDPAVYTGQIDAQISGNLLAFSANGALPADQPLDNAASAIQGGSRFLVWQNSFKELQMYDAEEKTFVKIGDFVPKDAAFLTVDGDTAVWVENTNSTSAQNGQANAKIDFGTFKWPVPIKATPGS